MERLLLWSLETDRFPDYRRLRREHFIKCFIEKYIYTTSRMTNRKIHVILYVKRQLGRSVSLRQIRKPSGKEKELIMRSTVMRREMNMRRERACARRMSVSLCFIPGKFMRSGGSLMQE